MSFYDPLTLDHKYTQSEDPRSAAPIRACVEGGEKVCVPRGGNACSIRVRPPHTGPAAPAAARLGLGVVNQCSPPSKRVVTHPLCSLANGRSQRIMRVGDHTIPSQTPRATGTLAGTVLPARDTRRHSCRWMEAAQVRWEPAVFKAAPLPLSKHNRST